MNGRERQLALRAERLARGERPLGWKVGFGSPAALARLGLERPLIGFLTDAGLLADGAHCSLAGWVNPMLEAEIAAYLDADGVIAGLAAAIELADLQPSLDDVEEILAGNVFHRHVVLGPVDHGRHTAEGVTCRVLRNGAEVAATDDPEALTGTLAEVVRAVRETVGEELRPGDIVITGAVVPPLPVAAGDSIIVELPPLGTLRLDM